MDTDSPEWHQLMHDRLAINFSADFTHNHPRFPVLLQAYKETERREMPQGRTAQWEAIQEFIRDGVEAAISTARSDRPTLVITGGGDRVVPVANSHKLVARIRGSQLCVLPGAGHMFWEEQLEETATVVSKFLCDV